MEAVLNEAALLAASITPIVMIFVQLLKQSDINKKWLPWISIGLGTGIGITVALALGAGVFLYGLAGLLAGASASGVYDAGKSVKGDK